jgi:hypothetical protein
MGNKGKQALVKLWIRQSHAVAKKTAALVRDSQLLNTTCCLTNINEPTNFWRDVADLPDLGKRRLIPYQQGQFLITSFVPREMGSVVAEPNKDLYFRIFLKCCFSGPRMGYSHEPGLDNMCTWCGFQFPNIPSVIDTDTEGKSALVTQNVKMDGSAFVELLDTIHKVNKVDAQKRKVILSKDQMIVEFSKIVPPPVPEWESVILETYERFQSLPPDAEEDSVARAAGPISDVTIRYKEFVQRKFKSDYQDILDKMVRLPWSSFIQVLQSYFIVPYERKLNNYDGLFIPEELHEELTRDHIQKAIVPILEIDLQILKIKQSDFMKEKYEYARNKIDDFVKHLSVFLPYKQKINANIMQKGDRAFEFIQELLLYGPLSSLLDKNIAPTKSTVRMLGDPSENIIDKLVSASLFKYNKEYLTYDDKEIKEMIEVANEKERTLVLAKYNKMNEDEKQVEQIKQRLRMDEWSIGARIHAYDGEVWEIEERRRREMGIVDFPDSGEVEFGMGRIRSERHQEEYEEEGYDVRQHAYED